MAHHTMNAVSASPSVTSAAAAAAATAFTSAHHHTHQHPPPLQSPTGASKLQQHSFALASFPPFFSPTSHSLIHVLACVFPCLHQDYHLPRLHTQCQHLRSPYRELTHRQQTLSRPRSVNATNAVSKPTRSKNKKRYLHARTHRFNHTGCLLFNQEFLQADVMHRILHRQRVKRSDKRLEKMQKQAQQKLMHASASFASIQSQESDEHDGNTPSPSTSASTSTAAISVGDGKAQQRRTMGGPLAPNYVRIVDSIHLRSEANPRGKILILPPTVDNVMEFMFPSSKGR